MFGLTKWEKFRKHVTQSKLNLSQNDMWSLREIIKWKRLTNKKDLVRFLRSRIGQSIIEGDPPHPAYDQPRWDSYERMAKIIEKELTDS